QGVVWGLMGCVMAFGASITGERSRGTLLRLTTAPITRNHILVGKALACFLTCLFVQGLLMAMAVLIFRVRASNPLMLVVAMVLCAVAFVGVMMVVAGLSKSEGSAAGMGRALVLVLAMIGGGTVPVFILPRWVQTASLASPFRWANMSVEAALWRGLSWTEFLPIAAVLIGCGVVGFVIGSAALRWSER